MSIVSKRIGLGDLKQPVFMHAVSPFSGVTYLASTARDVAGTALADDSSGKLVLRASVPQHGQTVRHFGELPFLLILRYTALCVDDRILERRGISFSKKSINVHAGMIHCFPVSMYM